MRVSLVKHQGYLPRLIPEATSDSPHETKFVVKKLEVMRKAPTVRSFVAKLNAELGSSKCWATKKLQVIHHRVVNALSRSSRQREGV